MSKIFEELSVKVSTLEVAMLMLLNVLRNTVEMEIEKDENTSKCKLILEIPEGIMDSLEKIITKKS